jgi:hypothetical protein
VVAFFVVMCALGVAVLLCLLYLGWAVLTTAAEYLRSAWRGRGRAAVEPVGAESRGA